MSLSEFDWVGHMGPGDQRSAWDKGEIDCGYMWGGNMRYLQENPWCSSPDTSSSEYRGPCAAEGKGLLGYSLYTGGMSKRWAKETWNNLVVTDAFAAAHPRTVYRSVKVAATADTKLVQDVGWYKNSATRVCDLAIGCQISCGAIDTAFVYNALSFDTWLDYTTQQSGDYVGERVAGECAKETIGQYPNNDAAERGLRRRTRCRRMRERDDWPVPKQRRHVHQRHDVRVGLVNLGHRGVRLQAEELPLLAFLRVLSVHDGRVLHRRCR